MWAYTGYGFEDKRRKQSIITEYVVGCAVCFQPHFCTLLGADVLFALRFMYTWASFRITAPLSHIHDPDHRDRSHPWCVAKMFRDQHVHADSAITSLLDAMSSTALTALTALTLRKHDDQYGPDLPEQGFAVRGPQPLEGFDLGKQQR